MIESGSSVSPALRSMTAKGKAYASSLAAAMTICFEGVAEDSQCVNI
jgi:hypothetical protein